MTPLTPLSFHRKKPFREMIMISLSLAFFKSFRPENKRCTAANTDPTQNAHLITNEYLMGPISANTIASVSIPKKKIGAS